jgi:menaquinone-dependent protoporphyrinogen oxidase
VNILVSAASRHGATTEVATHIAEALRADLPGDTVVEVLPAADAGDTRSYDAFVLGSAVYMGRWLEDACKLVELIATRPPRPVWLFSSGPVGDPAKPTEEPAEKAVVRALRVPAGDFRDWDAITAWAKHIAAELSQATTW